LNTVPPDDPTGGDGVTATIITTRELSKTYPGKRGRGGPVEAVRGVDLEVSGGEIVGFLGPNGAGKTTTLRMLTTLLEPTAGEATVNGFDLRRDAVNVRRSIGYVAQAGSSYPLAIVGEEIVDHARLYGVERSLAEQRTTALFAKLDLEGMGRRQVKTLSGGQRRRLDIAMGLVHEPTLVFLDEPTTGLDPQSRANLWQHIRGLRDDLGTTVFLTTHYLEEADALCDRILIIDQGRIVAEGTPEALKRGISGDGVTLTFDDGSQASQAATVAVAFPGAQELATDGDTVRFRVPDGGRAIPSLLRELDAAGVHLTGVEVRRPTLDDVFLSLTGRSLRDHAAA
jgi:ABC-2 type transport system ATP-binding protein